LNTANPDIFVSEASWKDNPWLTPDQIEEMRRRLTPQALKVREEGKFVKQVGLVASWFNRQIHVIEMDKLPPGDTYFGLDFGFSNPCCGLYVRVDRDGNLWIFDGWYRRGMTNPDIQKLMGQKDVGQGMIRRIADSAQASDIKQMVDSGISIIGVSKESGTSKESWDEFRARLMEQYGRVNESTNKPKIFISSKLVDINDNPQSPLVGSPFNFLVAELEGLRWEEVKGELGLEQKAQWGKQANHAIDALTYIIVSIQKPAESFSPGMTVTGGIQPLDPSMGMF
jgi:hypothetical protein